ncbi:MAG: hypothetical protein U0235_16315 [Polyangiaceae bacterium]
MTVSVVPSTPPPGRIDWPGGSFTVTVVASADAVTAMYEPREFAPVPMLACPATRYVPVHAACGKRSDASLLNEKHPNTVPALPVAGSLHARRPGQLDQSFLGEPPAPLYSSALN